MKILNFGDLMEIYWWYESYERTNDIQPVFEYIKKKSSTGYDDLWCSKWIIRFFMCLNTQNNANALNQIFQT